FRSTNHLITYNDTLSIPEIVSWGKSRGFGGYSLFILQQEYIAGASGDARYPLTSALYTEVHGPATAPAIVSVDPLSAGKAGTGYSQALASAGSPPIVCSVAGGSLPQGLSLDPSTGVISGTPTNVVVFTFTIRATNGA